MRINYWVGMTPTAHIPREILEKNDININIPILPTISKYEKFGWILKLIQEENSVVPGLPKIFSTIDKEEFNIGTYTLSLDDNDVIFTYWLPLTPAGSRFWFFKLKTIELYLEEYTESLKNVSAIDWITIRKRENTKLANLSKEKIIELAFERLDQMADRYGADEWKPFTPNDYFNNGDQSETPLLFRLYTKP
jgi:hypothetical protein